VTVAQASGLNPYFGVFRPIARRHSRRLHARSLIACLERLRIPRLAGTVPVMVSVMIALVVVVPALRGQAQSTLEQLPEAS
jgi:predicted PurR-regulated permease PerM